MCGNIGITANHAFHLSCISTVWKYAERAGGYRQVPSYELVETQYLLPVDSSMGRTVTCCHAEGETMVECAIREAFEETGMHLLNNLDAGQSCRKHGSLAMLQHSVSIVRVQYVWGDIGCLVVCPSLLQVLVLFPGVRYGCSS